MGWGLSCSFSKLRQILLLEEQEIDEKSDDDHLKQGKDYCRNINNLCNIEHSDDFFKYEYDDGCKEVFPGKEVGVFCRTEHIPEQDQDNNNKAKIIVRGCKAEGVCKATMRNFHGLRNR